MSLRSFALLSVICLTLLTVVAMPAQAQSAKQLIELRTYHFASPEKLAAFETFAAETMIPALNRAGVKPVGLFKIKAADNPDAKLDADPNDLIMVLPFSDATLLTRLPSLLDADKQYQAAGRDILGAGKDQPAYLGLESSLLLAFDGVPQVEVPHRSEDRVLQLRTYQSHNADRALRKIEMFNEGGELEIFRRVGIAPVFFGQAIAGDKLPNLTYLVSFENTAALDKGWVAFRGDAAWNKLKLDERYKDTVSAITNTILRPAQGSQI